MMHHQPSQTAQRPDVTAIVEALGESYVLEILDAVSEMPRSAKEIARDADVPSTTLYRRLDGLVDVGLVEQTMRLDGDGDHYNVYRGLLERLRIGRGEDGLDIDVDIEDDAPAAPTDGARDDALNPA